MTTYGAYNAGLPCKNTACKSHGRPHPNCRCYGEYASGGEVDPFCSVTRSHNADCEYFADGGQAGDEGIVLDPLPEDEGLTELPPGVEIDPLPGEAGIVLDPLPGEREQPLADRVVAGLEGIERGVVGPIAGLSDRLLSDVYMPWVDDEVRARDKAFREGRAERAAMNPAEAGVGQAVGLIGGLLTGTGQAALAAKASQLAVKETAMGAQVIQNAIQGGLIQASDEVTKWALGEGDPEGAAGAATSIGAAALFSGFLGGVGQAASKGASVGLKKLADAKIGERGLSFLRGLGFAAKSQDDALRKIDFELATRSGTVIPQAYRQGAAFFDRFFMPTSTATIGAVHGYHREGVEGALEGALYGAAAGIGGRKLGTVAGRKVIGPAAFKVLSSGNVRGMAQAMDHAAQMAKGSVMIDRFLDGVFKASPAITPMAIEHGYGMKRLKKDLDDFIGNGGMTEALKQDLYNAQVEPVQGFAEGGEVKPMNIPPASAEDNGVAMHYPAQNVLLSTARGRVSNYLKQLRPSDMGARLPFDDKPDQRQAKKTYDRALDIALKPLSVMDEVRKGTVEPDHIKHLNMMYPELIGLLQKRITERVIKSQMDGKKPPYKVRQGLSMLLGAPLSGEMTPQAIQAAQAVFANGVSQPATAPAQAPKSGSRSALSKSDQAFLTGPQARQRRSQRLS